MTTDEYTQFCVGVQRITGIDLAAYKRQQMERRIRSFLQSKKAPSMLGFLDTMRASKEDREGFLDHITINVSELYRNPEQYETLRRSVLPALAGAAGSLRIWSAGCSYGAEAFTLACVVLEELGPMARFSITGTDIDRRIVTRAQRGRFSQADVQNVPPAVLKRWFEQQDGGWVAREGLRKHISFTTGDLLRDAYRTGWDLVLCRNVVIYFNEDRRDEVHRKISASLRPGGYLMVGSTERVANAAAIGLRSAYPFIYERSS
jgi:chemotaxis protein methyltransferase CheR